MTQVLGEAVYGTLTAEQIETWPLAQNVSRIVVEGDELQARCPRTNNPDIYTFVIEHGGSREAESKALKMYLLGFRDAGISCADLAAAIAADLTRLLDTPVTVTLRQQTRGGMNLNATAVGA